MCRTFPKVILGRLQIAALCLVGLLAGCPGAERSAPIFATERGAIDGADPVGFFSEGRALRGDPEIWTEWRGARWHFVSIENRDRFQTDPERYAPRFGGYCAYGVASGYAVKSEPEAWTIVEGRLYLNYDLETREEWLLDRDAQIAKARENWPSVLD
jgi:hypothetical protein